MLKICVAVIKEKGIRNSYQSSVEPISQRYNFFHLMVQLFRSMVQLFHLIKQLFKSIKQLFQLIEQLFRLIKQLNPSIVQPLSDVLYRIISNLSR